MTSSVFFKFKSQKEPTRVEFDGTGISVFELKREIIVKSGLGDGTDFDLFMYTDDNSLEYDDDTTIIPRSTTVIARRQPALKPGAGRAARYVSGKMPVTAKNAGRKEQATKASASKPSYNAINQMNNAMTEEEKMAAMFAAQTEQWSAQQEEMSHQTPVFKPGSKRPANVPDHDPPNGYICYRCGNKGHWIQLCPTNDDPEFDNRPRVKRTTGIPRSFLQKVDKSVVLAQTEGDESKRPSGIMVNAEGDFVIAEPDKASWEQFQAKAKTSSTAKANPAEDKEIQERGLECSIDKKMFIEPMKTPCCKKTFCNDCITNALIESDFICPACQTEGVLIDDLQPDEDASKKIQGYLKEKEATKTPPLSPKPVDDIKVEEKPEEKLTNETKPKSEIKPKEESEEKPNDVSSKEKSKSPAIQPATAKSPPSGPKALVSQGVDKQASNTKLDEINTKKRPADDILDNPRIPKGPKAMQNQNQQNQNMVPNMMNGMNGMNMGMNNMMFGGMPMMPNMMGMPNMGNMNMNMGMPMMGMPGMMGMPSFPGMDGYGGMNNWGMNMNGMNPNMGNMNNFQNGGMSSMNGMGNAGMNGFQQNNFSNNGSTEEDAYFRKPVNPHRHQNKQRRVRPSDYREL
ncbi:DWNN domain-containing protein [Mariannaea sp. PMI_226]|nr:DWNN domain-containing protein [Mariannaea sp. PMI_226]